MVIGPGMTMNPPMEMISHPMIILQMAKNSPTVINHPMIILQMAKNSPTVISHPMIILQMAKNSPTMMIILLIGMSGLGMTTTPMMKMVIKMDQITTIMMMTRIGRIGLGGIGICSSRNALLSKHYPAPDWYQ